MLKKTRFYLQVKRIFVSISLLALPCFASVTISGMTFDIAVVNDTAGQVTSGDYSFTQSGTIVTLSGHQPAVGYNAAYFLNHLSNGDEAEFLAVVDVTNLTNSGSSAGVMFTSTPIQTGNTWFRVGISGAGEVFYEKRIGGDTTMRTHLYNLAAGVVSIYIRAAINRGMLNLYISKPAGGSGVNWLSAGEAIPLPQDHRFGFFIEPRGTGSLELASFSTISITPRVQSNGLLFGMQELPTLKTFGISGLSDWLTLSPAAFSNVHLQCMNDIRSKYLSGHFADPYQDLLFKSMKTYLDSIPGDLSGDERDQIEQSSRNAMIYLADAINSYITFEDRKYPRGTPYKLYLNFDLNSRLDRVIQIVNACANIGLLDFIKDLFTDPAEALTYGEKIISCGLGMLDVLLNSSEYLNARNDADDILQGSARNILYLTLISILDNDFYSRYWWQLTWYIGQVRDLTEKLALLYGNNNIPLGVFSSIALWDLAHGSTTSSADLNLRLKPKFTDGGAYAEGADYLGYLNGELLPYYYIAMYNRWLPANLQLPGVKNSGYWLLNMADKSGFVAPVDDGNGGPAWLAPYAFINNDNAFKEYVKSCWPQGTNDPICFLTYPPDTGYQGKWVTAPIGVYEGVGKMNFKASDSADVSVTLITEKAGLFKMNGGSHDQQDDGSISIRRVKRGFTDIDQLIIDPGYPGYALKKQDEYYKYHNTVQINKHPYGGINPCPWGDGTYWLNMLGRSYMKDTVYIIRRMEGFALGSELVDAVSEGPRNSIRERKAAGGPGYSYILDVFSDGFQSKITYDTASDYALRSVLHAGDEVFVIDRISSDENDYSVLYNMPSGSAKYGNADNIYQGASGNSRIRLSVFCSDALNQSVSEDTTYFVNNTRVTRVRFSNANITRPPAGAYCSFLTVLEPADTEYTYGNPYVTDTGNTGNAQICVSRQLDADVIRYVFVNTVTNGVRGTVTIPALTGWHPALTTDAEYGIVEFDRNAPDSLSRTRLYYGTYFFYQGNTTPLVGIEQVDLDSLRLHEISEALQSYWPLVFDQEMITVKGNICTISGELKMGEGYLFAPVAIEGDFAITACVDRFYSPWPFGERNQCGIFVCSEMAADIHQTDYVSLVSDKYFSTVFQIPGTQSINSNSGQAGRLWLRLVRRGDQIFGYRSDDGGITWQDHAGSPQPYTAKLAYVGPVLKITQWSLASVTFSNLSIEKANYGNFGEGLSKHSTLTALGYSGPSSFAGWEMDPNNGYMYTSIPGGTDSPAVITTPCFNLSRANGVTVLFKAKFPTWFYTQNFRDSSRLIMDIFGANARSRYSLAFMPSTRENVNSGYDLQLVKHSDSVVLAQTLTNIITPVGEESPWLNFRIDLLPPRSNGGTGEIKIYYDTGNGNGFTEKMSVMDESYSNFSNLTFNYITGSDVDNYQIRIADISATAYNSRPDNPPVILQQPADTSVIPGDTAKFSVTATGSGTLSYQWYLDSIPRTNGTDAIFSIPNVTTRDAGSTIQCKVSNSYGTVYSRIATLTISDTTPPETHASLSPAPNAAGWNNSNISLTLVSTDPAPGSGVKSITYSANGANPISSRTVLSSSVTIPLSGEGRTQIIYLAQDSAGNVEQAKSINVFIDKTMPVLIFGSPVPSANSLGWNNTNVSLSYTVSDMISGVFSSIPASPLVFTSEGRSIQRTVITTDSAGNAASFTSPSFNIDKTSPNTSVSLSGTGNENGWYSTDVKVSLLASDSLSGIQKTEYSLDSASWTIYTTPLQFNAEGSYKVYFRSVDLAGNIEAPKVVEFIIDKTPPEAILTFDTSSKTIVIKGFDNLPDSVDVSVTSKRPIGFGKSLITYMLKDAAGNTLRIVLETKNLRNQLHAEVISVSYNNGKTITLAKNDFDVDFVVGKGKTGIIELHQAIDLFSEYSLYTSFQKEKGKTIISINDRERHCDYVSMNGKDRIVWPGIFSKYLAYPYYQKNSGFRINEKDQYRNDISLNGLQIVSVVTDQGNLHYQLPLLFSIRAVGYLTKKHGQGEFWIQSIKSVDETVSGKGWFKADIDHRKTQGWLKVETAAITGNGAALAGIVLTESGTSTQRFSARLTNSLPNHEWFKRNKRHEENKDTMIVRTTDMDGILIKEYLFAGHVEILK